MSRMINFHCPELFLQKMYELAKKKNIAPSAYMRRLIVQDLAKNGLLSVEDLVENQMTETGYRNGLGNSNTKKRGRPQGQPKTKTLLE